jgi:Eukaryotic mitochondrial regulator protein
MFRWYAQDASSLENPTGQPNYLGPLPDQPFPMNPMFRSQPFLDEEARELIWQKCVVEDKPLKAVSADLGVDIRRVAAVIRMKEIEKRWIEEVRHRLFLRTRRTFLHDEFAIFSIGLEDCTHGYDLYCEPL